MNTITITETYRKLYNFHAKAIGTWKVVGEKDDYKVLHRLKKDGTLASDRPNNTIKVRFLDLNLFLKGEKTKTTKIIKGKSQNGKDVVIAETHQIDNEPKVEKQTEANIKMDEEKNSETPNLPTADAIKVSYQISTRQARWICQLVEIMKSKPFTNQLVNKLGAKKVMEIIIEDLRGEKKPYSSITTAMRVWNMRIRKELYGTK